MSQKLNISFFEAEKEEKDYFSKRLKTQNISFCKEPINEYLAEKASDSEVICIFIYSKIDFKILDKLPKLKLIATRSTGYDHIDLDACKKRSIKVCNLPSYSQHSVAEHTFALLLSISRNIIKSSKQKRPKSVHTFSCFTLNEKNIGIVGTGRIGAEVIKIAKGFGMNVIAYDLYPNNDLSKKLDFQYVSLEKLLNSSDIISLHVSLLPETEHLIDSSAFNKMKKGVVLINTSRGKVVDSDALIQALNSGIVSAAGLDVIEGEEFWKEGPISPKIKAILKNGNIILTPHIAYYSKESYYQSLESTYNNIISFSENKPLNIVN